MFRQLQQDERGAISVEMAFIIPVLLVMALGSFEVSSMVARQSELQSAAAEAASIARAATDADPETIEEIMVASTGLEADKVTITQVFRCGTYHEYTTNPTQDCAEDDVVSTFIQIQLSDRYDPVWTKWGIGSGFDYNVNRTTQIG